MLTSTDLLTEVPMAAIDTRPVLLSHALLAKTATTLAQTWRALHRVVRARRLEHGVADQRSLERDALANLGEQMLKDVGASPWLTARAVGSVRDDLRRRSDWWPY